MERQQINIRLPKIIAESYNRQSSLLDIPRNTLYTMALYEYLIKRRLINVERENRTRDIC